MAKRRLTIVKKEKAKKPANRKELTIRLSPTVTGGLEVQFKESTLTKSGKRKTSTSETTSDTFATVSGAIQASDIRIADFVEAIRKSDPNIGPLFPEMKSRKKGKD